MHLPLWKRIKLLIPNRHPLAPLAEAETKLGRERADAALKAAIDRLAGDVLEDTSLAPYLGDRFRDIYDRFERRFLYGFFSEHVKRLELPTSRPMRVKLSLADWYIFKHGRTLDLAMQIANGIEDLLFEQEDDLHTLSKCGRLACHQPERDYFLTRYVRATAEAEATEAGRSVPT